MSRFSDLVDVSLEALIAPSFTRLGYAVRSHLDHWAPTDGYDLKGRVMVITGATSGLGMVAARGAAAAGATVEIVARNRDKALAACAALREEGVAGPVDFIAADLADLAAVGDAAAVICRRHTRVDVLVHNAGALDPVYARSPQGIEQTVASQVVGPHLLTRLLRASLGAAPGGRVLWVTSGGMYSQQLSVADLELPPDEYDGTTAYARAKRAQVTLAQLWAKELDGDGIVVQAMHPGWADTPGVRRSLPAFRWVMGPLLRTPEEGADTLVWLAADDGLPLASTGLLWLDRRPRPIHRLPATRRSDTPEERRRLWAWCEERTTRQ